jgi:cytochrome c oxidase cbb3-type subunit 3
MSYVTRGRGAVVVLVLVMTGLTAMALSLAAQAPSQGTGAAAPGQAGGAQAPAQGRRGTPPPGRGGGGMGAGPSDLPAVDAAAAGRGKTVYAAQCTSCHGEQARGTPKGANLVRSTVVLWDRFGSELGPYLKKGHPTAGSPVPTDPQIVDLANFLRQRVNDSLRGSPIFQPGNVLTGDAKAGATFFNGEGKCATCHGATSSLAGIGARLTPIDIQQRFLFPRTGRGRGAASPTGASAVTVSVTPTAGPSVSGTLIAMDDFNVSLRDASGAFYSFKRTPDLKIVKTDPLAAHIALLGTINDKQMHDVVAYLETLK